MPTRPPEPESITLTNRQRELVRFSLYAYQPDGWTKAEVDEVLDLFRGLNSEVRVYRDPVTP
jgi:hypothetical protein